MVVDISVSPWDRLAKLAPPKTPEQDLLNAAERYALRADIYAAAADLWEDAAMAVDVSPDPDPDPSSNTGVVDSVSQDGISVTYKSSAGIGNVQAARTIQQSKYYARARALRRRSKAETVTVHNPRYNPWLNTPISDQVDYEDIFIPVDGV